MSPWRREVRELVRLALPVAAVQLGMMAMGVVDAMMVGRVSEVDLAAVSIGHAYSFAFIVAGMGLLMALDPIVSQAVGARDDEAVARALQRGLLLALAASVPIALALLPAEPALALLGQDPEIAPVAAGYVRAIVPGVPFFLCFVVLRHTLQSMHVLRPITWTIVLANVANVGLNRVLIFGAFGLEPLGAVGSAWATTSCRVLMAAALLLWSRRWLGRHLLPVRPGLLSAGALGAMVRIGAPISLQVAAEVGAFCVMSLLVGILGATAASGSMITLNIASVAFMVPLGVSVAASVRVGNAIGRGDADGVRRASWVSLGLGAAVMSVSALLFVAVPEPLAGLYTGERAVVAVAVSLLPLAALFQVFDGLQVVATGMLRGAADTRIPMFVHLAGFWVFGMPLGAWLGFGGGRRDVAGVWWGLTVGLIFVALVLLVRVRAKLSHRIERVRVEERAEDCGAARPAAEECRPASADPFARTADPPA